jgi:hypothetical protein
LSDDKRFIALMWGIGYFHSHASTSPSATPDYSYNYRASHNAIQPNANRAFLLAGEFRVRATHQGGTSQLP